MFLAPDDLIALTGRVRAGHASGDQTEAYVRARETVPVRPLR